MNTYFNIENISKRFFFLFGKTQDTYCDSSLMCKDLETVLFEELKQADYERIIFYSKRQKLYCFDRESYIKTKNPKAVVGTKCRSSIIVKGPLMGRLKRNDEQQDTERQETEALHFDKMSELDAFTKIDSCIQDKEIKTAVIFTNADDFINFFGEVRTERGSESIHSTVYDAFNSYENLEYDNSNIVLFIFPQGSYGAVTAAYEAHPMLIWTSFFRNKLDTANVIEIPAPSYAEVRNAINYIRIKHGLKVEFSELDNICEMLAREIYANKKELKWLMQQLNHIAEQNKILNIEACETLCNTKSEKSAIQQLDELVGMKSVKQQIKAFIKQAEKREKTEHTEYISRLKPQRKERADGQNLHILLTGNPGTGKTTVAKLIGEIYYELGYLKTGRTHKVTRDDLVAGFVGQTALQTKRQIDEAMGGVLFLDEAYTLKPSENSDNDFGQEAINTILEAMSDRAGEFAFIAAGYPKEMEVFLKSNSGLPRRFGHIINIDDYTPDELYEIFKLDLKKRGYIATDDLDERMPMFFENWYNSEHDENWGNAGNVENLINSMYQNWCMRDGKRNNEGVPILDESDIPTDKKKYLEDVSEANKNYIVELQSMIGLKNVKDKINDIRIKMMFEKQNGTVVPGHYIFSGNPGTGKTTVAELMGGIFKSIGVLKKGHVVPVKRVDLVGEYVGQTPAKTRKVLESALDGVLFIDEAYSLTNNVGSNDYGHEVVRELLTFMEDNRSRVSVICAGYKREMEEFLRSNSGLASRFTEEIEFEDYSADELTEILKSYLSKRGFETEPEYVNAAKAVFDRVIENKPVDFGNARDVRKFADECISNLYRRLMTKYEGDINIIPSEEKITLTKYDVADLF